MNRQELLEFMTDYLCEELSAQKEEELHNSLKSDPELTARAREIEKIWKDLEKAGPDRKELPEVLDRVFKHITDSEPDELSDQDLDMAAGGINSNPYKQNPDDFSG